MWTVVLRAYQAFWNQRRYVPDNLLGDKGTVPAPIAKVGLLIPRIQAYPGKGE